MSSSAQMSSGEAAAHPTKPCNRAASFILPRSGTCIPDTSLEISTSTVCMTNRSSASCGAGWLPPPLSCSSHRPCCILVSGRSFLRRCAALKRPNMSANCGAGSSGAHGLPTFLRRSIDPKSSMFSAVSRRRVHAPYAFGSSPSPTSGHCHTHHVRPSVTAPRHCSPAWCDSCLDDDTYRLSWSSADSPPLSPPDDPLPLASGPASRRPGLLTSIMQRLCIRCRSTGPAGVLY